MGSGCIHIVPVHAGEYTDAEAKAGEILAWFVERGMVEAEPSDCIMADRPGHRFTPAIAGLFEDNAAMDEVAARAMAVFGLDIHCTGKRVFHPMEDAQLEMGCPRCGHIHAMDEAMELVGTWYEGAERVACRACGEASPLAFYDCVPDWGFSSIAITLWNTNGDLNADFIAKMSALFGVEAVRVVRAHL